MPEFDVDLYLKRMRKKNNPFDMLERRNFFRIGSRYDGI
jgi:hypothetical protein